MSTEDTRKRLIAMGFPPDEADYLARLDTWTASLRPRRPDAPPPLFPDAA